MFTSAWYIQNNNIVLIKSQFFQIKRNEIENSFNRNTQEFRLTRNNIENNEDAIQQSSNMQ